MLSGQHLRETCGRMAMDDEETMALIPCGQPFGKHHSAAPGSNQGAEPQFTYIGEQGFGLIETIRGMLWQGVLQSYMLLVGLGWGLLGIVQVSIIAGILSMGKNLSGLDILGQQTGFHMFFSYVGCIAEGGVRIANDDYVCVVSRGHVGPDENAQWYLFLTIAVACLQPRDSSEKGCQGLRDLPHARPGLLNQA